MITLINNSFKERRGKPALWIEGRRLAQGFKPHERFNLIISDKNREVRFERAENGDNKVSVRSARGNSNVDLPLIEVRDERLLDVFSLGMKLRVVVTDGLVVFHVHGDNLAAVERTKRFLKRVREGQVRVGSVFSGGGVLDKAIHEGMKMAGIDSYLKVVVESDERYVEALMANQPDLFRKDSIVINSLIEDVEFRKNFCLEVMIFGIPCTGSSQAGKSKLKIKAAEQHESAGACFYYALNMIKAAKPALIVLENVTNYESEMSYFVIKSVLKTWGYTVTETVLNGNEYGCLEGRERLAVVAHCNELTNAFSFDEMVLPLRQREESVNEVLEPVPHDSEMWRSYDYLKDKEVRDQLARKGFKRSLYDGTEQSVTTIRRLYHKGGSCDQFLMHPDYKNNGLTRKFTKTEHALLKAIPLHIIEGVSESVAHEILGQSITYWAFISVGYGIGLFSKINSGIIDSFVFTKVEQTFEGDADSVLMSTKFDLGTFHQLKPKCLLLAA